MGKNLKFSIIIPYYSGEEILLNYLKSIEISAFRDFEVIVINDGKEKLNLDKFDFPLKIIKNNDNLGYGRSLNKGVTYSNGEYLILSNSDIILNKNDLESFSSLLTSHTDIKIIQPILKNQDGTIDKFSKRYFPKKLSFLIWPVKLQNLDIPFRYFYKKPNENEFVECGKCAWTIVEKNVFLKLSGFSYDYWMFWEDVDFFLKAYRMKIPTYYCSDIPITHLDGETIKGIRLKANIGELISRTIFFKKWFNIPKKLVVLSELFGSLILFIINLLLIRRLAFSYYPRYIKEILGLL